MREAKELTPEEQRATDEIICGHCAARKGEYCHTTGYPIELRYYWRAQGSCHKVRLTALAFKEGRDR